MKDEIIMKESHPFVIEVNGKKYRIKKFGTKVVDHKLHGGETVFVPVDEEKLKEDVEFIVDNIEKLIDKKELLREALSNMELGRIERIKKLISKKAPMKKTHGCIGITIGDDSSGEYIQLA